MTEKSAELRWAVTAAEDEEPTFGKSAAFGIIEEGTARFVVALGAIELRDAERVVRMRNREIEMAKQTEYVVIYGKGRQLYKAYGQEPHVFTSEEEAKIVARSYEEMGVWAAVAAYKRGKVAGEEG